VIFAHYLDKAICPLESDVRVPYEAFLQSANRRGHCVDYQKDAVAEKSVEARTNI